MTRRSQVRELLSAQYEQRRLSIVDAMDEALAGRYESSLIAFLDPQKSEFNNPLILDVVAVFLGLYFDALGPQDWQCE